jgi:hypothetical protein
MVSVLALNVVACVFYPPSGQTKEYKIGNLLLLLSIKEYGQILVAWNQNNVSE